MCMCVAWGGVVRAGQCKGVMRSGETVGRRCGASLWQTLRAAHAGQLCIKPEVGTHACMQAGRQAGRHVPGPTKGRSGAGSTGLPRML